MSLVRMTVAITHYVTSVVVLGHGASAVRPRLMTITMLHLYDQLFGHTREQESS